MGSMSLPPNTNSLYPTAYSRFPQPSQPISPQLNTTSAYANLMQRPSASAFAPSVNVPANSWTSGAAASPWANAARDSYSPLTPRAPFVSPTPPAGASPLRSSAMAASNSTTAATGAEAEADKVGAEAGKVFAQLLKDNPALLEKAKETDWDALSENAKDRLEETRIGISGKLKWVPKWLDRSIISALPGPQMQQKGKEFFTWLRQPVDPAKLAEIKQRHREEALDKSRKSNGNSASKLDDPMASSIEEEAPPKKSLLQRTKERLWPFNKNKDIDASLDELPPSRTRKRPSPEESEMEDELPPSRPSQKHRPLEVEKPAAEPGSEEDGSDADLEKLQSMLRG